MSFIIPTYIMTGPSDEALENSNQTLWYENEESEGFKEVKAQIIRMMSLTLIACTVVFLMVCVIFEDEPKYPPSRARQKSIANKNDLEKQTTKGKWIKLLNFLFKSSQ